MDKINNFCISVDGLPYTGKTTLCSYLKQLDKKRLVIDDGIVRSITAARCISHAEPDCSSFKDTLVVYLITAKEDWSMRCKSQEVASRYDELMAEMGKTAQALADAGAEVLVYNTSKYTPYLIAKDIMKVLEQKDNAKSGGKPAELSAEAEKKE